MATGYRRPEEVWPTGGTPLVREVRSPYFMPVTEEILAEITRRIVAELDLDKIILFGSYAYERLTQTATWIFLWSWSRVSPLHSGLWRCRNSYDLDHFQWIFWSRRRPRCWPHAAEVIRSS